MALSKLDIVLQKNTYYFFNSSCEEDYDGRIKQISDSLVLLKADLIGKNLDQIKALLDIFLLANPLGLESLLALTGFSNESLKRLVTYIRVSDFDDLNQKLYRDKWAKFNGDLTKIDVWSDDDINLAIKDNDFFRKGIVNLLLEGSTLDSLCKILPLFELKKLSITKMSFHIESLLDTLVRYKIKGTYSADKQNNPEIVIEQILNQNEVKFERGNLPLLTKDNKNTKRMMDFIIPDKKNPKLIIESSFLVTTSSGQGDKAKAEIQMSALLKYNYPDAKFIGFVDGIGWLVRKSDLIKIVSAFEDVFTFREDELNRFDNLIKELFCNG